MTVMFSNYKVKNNKYGWIIQKKVGKQWREAAYFFSPGQVSKFLVDQLFYERTAGINLSLVDQAEAARILKELQAILQTIYDDLFEAING